MTSQAALWFLPFALPILGWVVLSDLKTMTIPNKAVLALVAVFAIVGLIALPFEVWAWRWLHLVVALVAGFMLNIVGAFGAGDAKFAAAMAPFVALGDAISFFLIFAIMIPVTFFSHRLFRAIPPIRRATAHWESWGRPTDFPFGLPLAGTLAIYLIIAALA